MHSDAQCEVVIASGLHLFSVWLHIVAAAVWIGGMAFLVLVLVPVIRAPEHREFFSSLMHRTGKRFRWVGWACLAVLVVTGFVNVASRFGWEGLWRSEMWRSSFGRVLVVKLVVVALVLLLSVVHDFVVGPRAMALWQENPGAKAAARLLGAARWLGRLNFLLALIVVGLAVMLVRGWL